MSLPPRPDMLREDAPEPLASERERVLQGFRERFRESGRFAAADGDESEARALDWIEALGAAGHVGAARLSAETLSSPDYLERLVRVSPARVETMAPRSRLAAMVLVKHECQRDDPDPEALCRWFGALGEEGAQLAAAVRELHAICGRLSAADRGCLAQEAVVSAKEPQRLRYGLHDGESLAAHVLYQCAGEPGRAAGAKLLERAAALGSIRAQFEVKLEAGGIESLVRWLDRMGGDWCELAAALREFRAVAGERERPGDRFLRSLFEPGGLGQRELRRVLREPLRGQLLCDFAMPRVASLRSEEREVGKRLLLRAAELGSGNAIAACLTADVELLCRWLEACGDEGRHARAVRELCEATGGIAPAVLAAPDKLAILAKWARRSAVTRVIGTALCLRVGAAIELGQLGAPPDVDAAITWYEAALPAHSPRDPATGAFTPTFCWEVAATFDRRNRGHRFDAPALALAWHDRGLAAGSWMCFSSWIEACAAADMGLAPDAAAAMRRVKDFVASHPREISSDFSAYTVQELLERAQRCPAAEAAQWRDMAELLRSNEVSPELETKLDLAQAYREMGDLEGARLLVGQVLMQGRPAQQAFARKLLEDMQDK